MTEYRTQKARGVMALSYRNPFRDYFLNAPGLYNHEPKVYPHRHYGITFPCFARPCPTVPRHGFVDSRVAYDLGDVLDIIAATHRADPDGEVIFMPKLDGKWSGIVTHAGVTFGLKNDGATTGHSARTIPAYVGTEVFASKVGVALMREATVKETAYLEFVEHQGVPTFVQLRDGPEVPRSLNYVPELVKVRKVIEPSGKDLLQWEARIAEFAGQEGVVVHHPGGSLTSHYAVHAIVHRIPVILDEKRPKVGSVLKPAGWEPAPLTEADYEALAECIARRFKVGYGAGHYRNQTEIARTAIAVLHAAPQWGNEPHLIRLRAEGIAATLMFSAAAIVGELRHWWGEGPGQVPRDEDGDGEPIEDVCSIHPNPTCEVMQENGACRRDGRRSVYEVALVSSPRDLRRWVKQAVKDYLTPGWDGGFGGPKWAECASVCEQTFGTVAAFLADPCEITWKAVMVDYNRLVHVSHNNGAVLTKWVNSAAMTVTAAAPGPSFVNSFAARVALGLDILPALAVNRRETALDLVNAA